MTTRTIEMNSRQRVQRALSHQEPDRVPMMMSASRWVVEQLKEHLGGIETDRQLMQTLRLDVWDTRGLDYESGIGARYVGPRHFAFSEDCAGNLFEFFNYHEEITANEFGPAYAMGRPSIGVDAYPTLADLEAFPWPRGDWFDFADVRRQLEPWAEDFAIAATGASVFQHPMLFRGIEQLSLEMAAEPEIAKSTVTVRAVVCDSVAVTLASPPFSTTVTLSTLSATVGAVSAVAKFHVVSSLIPPKALPLVSSKAPLSI